MLRHIASLWEPVIRPSLQPARDTSTPDAAPPPLDRMAPAGLATATLALG